jgi:hypothetical protein
MRVEKLGPVGPEIKSKLVGVAQQIFFVLLWFLALVLDEAGYRGREAGFTSSSARFRSFFETFLAALHN